MTAKIRKTITIMMIGALLLILLTGTALANGGGVHHGGKHYSPGYGSTQPTEGGYQNHSYHYPGYHYPGYHYPGDGYYGHHYGGYYP